MSSEDTINVAKSLRDCTLKIRRNLHEIPELGWEEEKTLAFIKNQIEKFTSKNKYAIKINWRDGGIWVDVDVDKNKPRFIFRSDIDALPIQEETELHFSSKHSGKMHACGHDCHSAMLLSAFKAISQNMIQPKVNVRFVWQRSEEFAKHRSGGESLVKDGVCDGVDNAFGLHIAPMHDGGVFFSKPDEFLANSSQIHFVIECSGGHAMRPNVGSNAINVMNDILNSLRGAERLFFTPNESVVFTPTIARSGDTPNIRPNNATMCFSFRNFLSESMADSFVKNIKDKIYCITSSYPTAKVASFNFISGYPTLKNDEKSYHVTNKMLKSSGFQTVVTDKYFAGEDFAYYLKKIPGSFWFLGARKEPAYDLHTSKFNPDENYLWCGVAYWLLLSQLDSIDNVFVTDLLASPKY